MWPSVDKDDIFHAVKAIVAAQRDYGRRDDRKQARLKYLVHEWGIDKFRWGGGAGCRGATTRDGWAGRVGAVFCVARRPWTRTSAAVTVAGARQLCVCLQAQVLLFDV